MASEKGDADGVGLRDPKRLRHLPDSAHWIASIISRMKRTFLKPSTLSRESSASFLRAAPRRSFLMPTVYSRSVSCPGLPVAQRWKVPAFAAWKLASLSRT